MTIENYIIRGGENLNSPPKTFGNFSPNELKTFEHWHVKLGKDDTEKENYIECPADVNTRLFIRAFWSEPSGHRPVCYYVGLLIPRSLYEEAGEYFRINRGLCAISLLTVQRALESNKPIDVNIEWPLTRTAIGQPFEVLSNWKRYGEVEYCSNMNDMLSSISINIIDDWFSRLFVAVNPYQSDPAYHMIVSRKKPLPFKDRIIENTSFGTNQHVFKKNKSESVVVRCSRTVLLRKNICRQNTQTNPALDYLSVLSALLLVLLELEPGQLVFASCLVLLMCRK